MSRPAKAPGRTEADPRIPFPRTDVPLACRQHPHLFLHEYGQSSEDDLRRIALAKQACGGCPIVADCLKWALANRELTPTNVWAATTARERNRLRKRLELRHGADWVDVIVRADQRRARCRTTPTQYPTPTPLVDAQQPGPDAAADHGDPQHERDVLPVRRRRRSTKALATAT